MSKVATVVTALGIVFAAVGKFLQGGELSYTEIALAVTTISAALGFQKKA